MNLIVLAILITMTITMGLTVFIFSSLLRFNRRVKDDVPKELTAEIEKHRDIYEFIKKRRFVNPETLVVDFQKVSPKSSQYIKALGVCKEELKERSTGEHKTLVKMGNFYELSSETKEFFVYENPTLKQLMKSVFK